MTHFHHFSYLANTVIRLQHRWARTTKIHIQPIWSPEQQPPGRFIMLCIRKTDLSACPNPLPLRPCTLFWREQIWFFLWVCPLIQLLHITGLLDGDWQVAIREVNVTLWQESQGNVRIYVAVLAELISGRAIIHLLYNSSSCCPSHSKCDVTKAS